MPRAGDQVLGDRGSAPARGIGRVAVAAGGQLRVRVTKSPEPSHPRLSPARMIGARTPSGGPAQCRQHVQRGAATAGRHRRRSATAANLIRAQHMVRGCQAAAMAPPDRAAGRLTPLCGRRKEPHPTISPSGPFLFDIHGKRGYIGMRSQPAPHSSADHRPAWRCDAGPDVRRAVGVCMMGRARGSHLTSAIWQGTLCPKKEVKMILKEPHARAA